MATKYYANFDNEYELEKVKVIDRLKSKVGDLNAYLQSKNLFFQNRESAQMLIRFLDGLNFGFFFSFANNSVGSLKILKTDYVESK